MSFICNLTFVMAPEQEKDFLSWFRTDALPILFNVQSPARSPQLAKVIAHGNQPIPADHGLSIALQAWLANETDANNWFQNQIPEVSTAFMGKFGPHAALFSTTLETLGL